jgi:hypothetical protein
VVKMIVIKSESDVCMKLLDSNIDLYSYTCITTLQEFILGSIGFMFMASFLVIMILGLVKIAGRL